MAKYKLLGTDTSTGQLKQSESMTLNVIDFGAFNNETNATATTTAISNAITAAAASGGQKVYLPTGKYLVNSTLTIPGGVTLVGDGQDRSVIVSNTNQVILNLTQGSGDSAFLGPKVRDLQIKGSKTAGTSQIGIKLDDALYLFDAEITNVRILTCGSHGLYVGKAFSSRFVNIFSSDHNGYPFLIDGSQMPSNHFESLYAGDLNTGFLAGFRIRKGNVTLVSCNGVNVSPSDSWWAIIGDVTGLESDGLSTNSTTSLSLVNCNIESTKAGGIKSYANSVVDFIGQNYFVGDSTGSGAYKPLLYDIDTGIYPYPALTPKGTINDRVVFSNSYYTAISGTVAINGTTTVLGTGTAFTTDLIVGQLVFVNGETRKIQSIANNGQLTTTVAFTTTASGQTLNKIYYAEGEVVHSDEIPPIQVSGQGPKIAGGEFQYKYYNSTNSRSEALYRSDASLTKQTVTSTSTYTNPGIRLYEVNASSAITLTIPWSGWYPSPETIFILNKSAASIDITITSGGGGTIDGQSSIKINQNKQLLSLTANGDNWETTSLTNTDRVSVKTYGAKGDGTTNDTTAVNNAKIAALALGVPLYFPSGNYLTDGITIADTQSVKICGDSPLKSKITSRVGTAPALLFTSNSSHVHTILVENLGIVGFGSNSANHGISVTGSLQPSNFTIRNVTISNIAGNGINVTAGLFTQLYEGVDISVVAGGGNGFDILGSNDCTFVRCYVHTVGTSKAAYRIHSGVPTFIGCNGIDSGTTANWGTFGDVTADDGVDRFVRAVLIGTNIEDFTDTGIRFKVGSTGSFIGTTITAPASGTVKALVFDFVESNTGGFFDSASGITTNGASWTNSEPVHSSGMPFIQVGHRKLTTYRDTNVGASTTIPGITGTLIAGQSDYALTFDGIARFKNYIKIDETSAPPTPAANSINLYAKDKAGTSALYFKNDAGTETEIGGGTTSFANPTAAIGLSAVNGSASTAMRSDAAPALSQAIAPTWTGLHTFNPSTTPSNVVLFDIAALGTDGTRNSHNIVFRGRSRSTTQHTPEWRILNAVTSNAGASKLSFQHQFDSGGWGELASCDDSGLIVASSFQGDGSLLTNIDISNVVGSITTAAFTMATDRILGRSSASTGVVEEISIGSGLSLSGGVLSASGGSTLPFADSSAIIKGSSDATKLLRFEVDGFTTATTRVVTVPDADLTMVGEDTTQTLTNKTIDGSFNTVIVALSDLDPSGSNATFSQSTFNTTFSHTTGIFEFNWTGATSTNPLMRLRSTNTSATGYILDVVADAAGSQLKPLRLQARQATILDTTAFGDFTFSPRASISGAPSNFTFTGSAHTGLTAGTEITDFNVNLNRIVQRASGNVTLDRAVRFQGRTVGFTGSSTVTDAINVDIESTTAGTNATITRSTALRVRPVVSTHQGLWVDGVTSQTGDLLCLGFVGTKIARFVPNNGTMNSVFLDTGAIASNATDGFQYFSRIDSATNPNGTPTSYNGSSPIVIQSDTVGGNYRLWAYLNSAWRNFPSTTSTDTFTNKTIDGGSNTLTNIPNSALDSDLAALGNNSTNGLWARTGSGTGSARTITAGSAKITVTNGDGVSGNPTINAAQKTIRKDIINWSAIPDASGNVFSEPYSIKATNDFWRQLVYVFNDTATDDYLYGSFTVPTDYTGGATAVITWTTTATSGNVRWEFAYRAIGGDDTESFDQSTAQETVTVTDAAPSAAHEKNTVTVALTAGNFAADDVVTWRLARTGTNAGDTMAAAAMLFSVQFQYVD